MKPNEGSAGRGISRRLFLSSLFVIIYIALVWQLAGPLLAWSSFRKTEARALLSAVKYDSGNAVYHYLLGRHYHHDLGDADAGRAAGHYRKSLELNPLQPGAWLDMAKVFQQEGRPKEAEHAFERAVRLSPNNAELQWEAGTFWLMNNMTDKAVDALRSAILVDPSRQIPAYDLCWKLGVGNGYIMEHLLPDAYPYQRDYLRYLMASKRTAEAQEVWKSMNKEDLEKELFIAYVTYLIGSRLYDPAWSAWQEITGILADRQAGNDAGESLVWNQSFEEEMLNGGFDWVIREAEGVNVFIDESTRMTGTKSLGVLFDGRHNPDIVIAEQVVRLTPDSRYSLRAHVRTDSLTTSNGIFLQVRGHDCQGLDRSTGAVTGSNFWQEVSLDFDLPSHCSAVTVMIRRARSAKLDNKIEGTAWIDGVALKLQNSIATNSSRKP